MNILFNQEEKRFRAGSRFLILVLFGGVATYPASFFKADWIVYPVLALGFFGATYITVRSFDMRDLDSIGLRINTLWWKEFWIGSTLAAVIQLAIFMSQYVLGWLEITGFGWDRVGETHWLQSLSIFFIQMLCVGFYEELLFRGYAVRNLAEAFNGKNFSPVKGAWIAVIGTSVLFGLAHAGNPNASLISTFNIIIAGLMLGVPFILTGRLALSIGVHFSWNFIMGGMFGMSVSGLDARRSIIQTKEVGPDIWTGGNFGPEAGIIGLIAIAIITFCIFIYAKRMNGNFDLDNSFKITYLQSIDNKAGE